MPAGFNAVGNIIRYDYDPDDYVGGAMPSGTVIHESVWCRIDAVKPTMVLLEQGVETTSLFQTRLSYKAKNVQENDEFVVTAPVGSIYENVKFRLISVQHTSMRSDDPRNQILVVMRKRSRQEITD
jgi:hypothetical protein